MVLYDNTPEEHIIIHGEIPRRFKASRLGTSHKGSTYVTYDGDVFKELHLNEKQYNDFVHIAKLDSNYIAFPKQTVYKDKRCFEGLKGYLADRAYGSQFSKLDTRTKIGHLIRALSVFEKEIIKLSKEECVVMNGMSANNLIYLPNTRSITATESEVYTFNTSSEYPFVAQMNIRLLSIAVLDLLVKNYNFKSEKLYTYYDQAITNGKRMPSEVLTELVLAIEKETDMAVSTIEDFQRGIPKLVRK